LAGTNVYDESRLDSYHRRFPNFAKVEKVFDGRMGGWAEQRVACG